MWIFYLIWAAMTIYNYLVVLIFNSILLKKYPCLKGTMSGIVWSMVPIIPVFGTYYTMKWISQCIDNIAIFLILKFDKVLVLKCPKCGKEKQVSANSDYNEVICKCKNTYNVADNIFEVIRLKENG